MLNRTQPPAVVPLPNLQVPRPGIHAINEAIPLFTYQDNTQPVVQLDMVYKAGNWYAPQVGTAYFTAKMLTKGTKKKDTTLIAAYIERYGARLKVKAKDDAFHIQLITLSEYLKPLIALVAELLFTSTFPWPALEALKPIVLQKIRLQDANPAMLAQKKLRIQVFGADHPYAHALQPTDVEAITPELLSLYHKQHALQECQFFLSGDFNETDIERLQTYFGKVVPPTRTPSVYNPTPCLAPLHIPQKNSLQASIALGKSTITRPHPDYPSLYITQMLLGGYFGSRLMRYIREKKGYTYGIYAGLIPLVQKGYLYIATEAKQDKVPQTLDAIQFQMQQLQTVLVPQEELQDLKNYLTGHLLTAFQGAFSRTDQLCSVYLHGLDLTYYERLYTTLQQITPLQIRTMAQRYLQPETLSRVVVGGTH